MQKKLFVSRRPFITSASCSQFHHHRCRRRRRQQFRKKPEGVVVVAAPSTRLLVVVVVTYPMDGAPGQVFSVYHNCNRDCGHFVMNKNIRKHDKRFYRKIREKWQEINHSLTSPSKCPPTNEMLSIKSSMGSNLEQHHWWVRIQLEHFYFSLFHVWPGISINPQIFHLYFVQVTEKFLEFTGVTPLGSLEYEPLYSSKSSLEML